jgi:hypothetical protein
MNEEKVARKPVMGFRDLLLFYLPSSQRRRSGTVAGLEVNTLSQRAER